MNAGRARGTLKPAVLRRPGRPPGPSQAAELRRRLITEASALYAEGGSPGLSLAVLAERTGLTKPTVFHYFANKDALLRAVFEAFAERLERTAAGWFDPPPASHAARLERLVASLIAFYGADPLNARILCHALLEAEHLRSWRGPRGDEPPVFGRFVRRFSDFIQSGIDAGEFYPDRSLGVIMSIGGIILFEFMLPERGREFSGGLSLAERRREMTALIRRAVVRPGARWSGNAGRRGRS